MRSGYLGSGPGGQWLEDGPSVGLSPRGGERRRLPAGRHVVQDAGRSRRRRRPRAEDLRDEEAS